MMCQRIFPLSLLTLAYSTVLPAAAAAAAHRAQPSSRFVQDRFAISFFLDPTPSDDTYAFIRDANFTVILGANYPSNRSEAETMFRLCAKYGLKCIANLKGWTEPPWFAGGNRTASTWTFRHPLPQTSSHNWGFVSAATARWFDGQQRMH